MAYPTVSSPYGLKPYNLAGGRVYSGSTRMFPITNAYANSLWNGDVVGLGSATGALATTTYGTASASASAGLGLGIFVGCEYSSVGGPIYGKNRYQYWLGGTVANDAVGYVVDDPNAYFRTAVLAQPITTLSNTTTTIGYMNPQFVGSNVNLVSAATGQSTGTGDSLMGVSGAIAASGIAGSTRTVSSCPFRVIQVVPDTAVTVSGTATGTGSSTATVTLGAANAAIQPGMQFIAQIAATGAYVTGAAPGNYNTVLTNNGTTTITVSTAVSINASTAVNVTYLGYPEVIVGWNFGYHAYLLSAGF
ncbi:MAG: hypothetical protein WCO62_00310 [Betaproteobacteria bacterium]